MWINYFPPFSSVNPGVSLSEPSFPGRHDNKYSLSGRNLEDGRKTAVRTRPSCTAGVLRLESNIVGRANVDRVFRSKTVITS